MWSKATTGACLSGQRTPAPLCPVATPCNSGWPSVQVGWLARFPSARLAGTGPALGGRDSGVGRGSGGDVAALGGSRPPAAGTGPALLEVAAADARRRGLQPVLDVLVRNRDAYARYQATAWAKVRVRGTSSRFGDRGRVLRTGLGLRPGLTEARGSRRPASRAPRGATAGRASAGSPPPSLDHAPAGTDAAGRPSGPSGGGLPVAKGSVRPRPTAR
jgi:hypothetical protein